MSSGVQSNSVTSKNWRVKKLRAGFQRVVLWMPPELDKGVSQYAFEKMVPKSVAVELILKEYFKDDKT